MGLEKDYKKFRWFFTSSGKLVIGGKSAQQNDSILIELKKSKKDYVVMHTSSPGSPFSIILSDIKDLSDEDIRECSIFTGCFSRAWRSGKSKALVDIFKLSQVNKAKSMKEGTWGVSGKIGRVIVDLELVLTKQQGILRAIPESSADSTKVLLKIVPGKIDKSNMISKFEILLEHSFSEEEILSALPSGGVKIKKI